MGQGQVGDGPESETRPEPCIGKCMDIIGSRDMTRVRYKTTGRCKTGRIDRGKTRGRGRAGSSTKSRARVWARVRARARARGGNRRRTRGRSRSRSRYSVWCRGKRRVRVMDRGMFRARSNSRGNPGSGSR